MHKLLKVETAKSCIQHLRENGMDTETFFPLNYINVRPLKERLRQIAPDKHVYLLYDMIKVILSRAPFSGVRIGRTRGM